jgi:hypothetical protein
MEAVDLRIGETIRFGEYDLMVWAAEGSQKTYERSQPSLAEAIAERCSRVVRTTTDDSYSTKLSFVEFLEHGRDEFADFAQHGA